jgi:hypothetical protein
VTRPWILLIRSYHCLTSSKQTNCGFIIILLPYGLLLSTDSFSSINNRMMVTFDNGALMCTTFNGTLHVHLKQTIKSPCLSFHHDQWQVIYEYLLKLKPTPENPDEEIHFRMTECAWVIICLTGTVVTICRREHYKGKCTTRSVSLPAGELKLLLKSSQNVLGTNVEGKSNPDNPPSFVPPPSLSRQYSFYGTAPSSFAANFDFSSNPEPPPSPSTLPVSGGSFARGDEWMAQFVESSKLPQM